MSAFAQPAVAATLPRARRILLLLTSVLILTSLGTSSIQAQDAADERPAITWPGQLEAGAIMLPNGWRIAPAGELSKLGDFPSRIEVHPSEPVLAIQHCGYGDHEVVLVEPKSGRILSRSIVPYSFNGIAWSPDGTKLFLSGGFDDLIYRYDYRDGVLTNRVEFTYSTSAPLGAQSEDSYQPLEARRVVAGLEVSDDGQTLYVANAFSFTVARFNAETGELEAEIPLGEEAWPYDLELLDEADRLYVSLWGRAEVAVIDTKTNEPLTPLKSQEHPNELQLSPDNSILYVANANRNTVSIFETETGKTLEVIATAIHPNAPSGCTPSSLGLTPDGKILMVANANTNDLAVFNVEEPGESKPLGFIPTGWYPTSVRIAPFALETPTTGDEADEPEAEPANPLSVFVTNSKGATPKANRSGPNPIQRRGRVTEQYIGGLFQGVLSRFSMPDPATMQEYSQTVLRNCPLQLDAAVRTETRADDNPIPAKVGDPSPIKYCIYIIKENRTYDQVFGDVPRGNGDPSICLFPEAVTPNHHALAEEFVLLDNFYVESEVSADGHEWTMGAYATDFVERLWPLGYRGDRRVPYPSEGVFEIAEPAGGYLWDRAIAKGVSVRSYGEFVRNGPTPDAPRFATVPALEGRFDPLFHSYDMTYPDVKRAARFISELQRFEREGGMPQLSIVRLPNDHTSGTRPGARTVNACVADNDLALGQLVEAVSRSKFWPEMAIFVVEDDAQNGPDHVDAHRTVALAISPYIKRGSLDSTLYTTSSMLRTMELILGLEPMSQFDAAATPMYRSFTGEADLTPYRCRDASVNLEERNLETAWGAELSKQLNLAEEDRADDLLFNEIIWKAVKGPDSPMPAPVRAAFILPKE